MNAATLRGVRNECPQWIAPHLATLVSTPPPGNDWLHEAKYDGYRIFVRRCADRVELLSRNRISWTARLPMFVRLLMRIKCDSAYLDGELTAIDAEGRTRFQLLQRALQQPGSAPLVLYLFDLLYLDGVDYRQAPLLDRKQKLRQLLRPLRNIHGVEYSEHIINNGAALFAHACANSFEGIISKKVDSFYESRRSRSWRKCKCLGREEFIVAGFTAHANDRRKIGALVLATRSSPKGPLLFRGKVGTGFSESMRSALAKRLDRLRINNSPVVNAPQGMRVTWVRPQVVIEVAFTEKTVEGALRHPVFIGVREDKPAKEVVEDRSMKDDHGAQ